MEKVDLGQLGNKNFRSEKYPLETEDIFACIRESYSYMRFDTEGNHGKADDKFTLG